MRGNSTILLGALNERNKASVCVSKVCDTKETADISKTGNITYENNTAAYKIKFLFTILVFCLAMLVGGKVWGQQTLTVKEGTENNDKVPFDGYNADASQHNQMIYPAVDLTAMSGKIITQMVFYIDQSENNGSNTAADRLGTWTVSLGETAETTLSGLDNTTTLTQVYEGYFDCSTGTLTLEFGEGYLYNGGNLLVDLNHAAASWNRWYFLGVAATGASYTYGSQRDFLPKTTFTYEDVPTCSKPTGLETNLTPGNGTIATIRWTENGSATNWILEYATASDFSGAISVNVSGTPSADLTNLTPETLHYARVKAVCGVDDESAWSSTVSFIPTSVYTITLNEGTTTNDYVPVYGNWVDNYSRSQFIIPASALTSLQWGTINKLTFYSSNTSVSWGNAQFDVRLKEVAYTTFSNTTLETWDDMDLAYSGSLAISGNVMEITFSTPYTYMGGNLMIGINETTSGSYSNCSWYGVSATGASLGGYGTSISQRDFLPKVTINYIPGEPPSCLKPTIMLVNNFTAHTVTLTWLPGASETAWEYSLDGVEWFDIENPTQGRTTYSGVINGLDEATTYSLQIRSDCGTDGYSDPTAAVSFTTTVACPAPTGLTSSLITTETALISWDNVDGITWKLQYKNNSSSNWTEVIDVTSSSYSLVGLDQNSSYIVQVQADCGSDGQSVWSSPILFTTLLPCPTTSFR